MFSLNGSIVCWSCVLPFQWPQNSSLHAGGFNVQKGRPRQASSTPAMQPTTGMTMGVDTNVNIPTPGFLPASVVETQPVPKPIMSKVISKVSLKNTPCAGASQKKILRRRGFIKACSISGSICLNYQLEYRVLPSLF